MSTNWIKDAICSQTDLNAWIAEHPHPSQVAALKQICSNCPVTSECLDYAITNHLHHGIWGGTTPRERADIAKRRRVTGGAR